MKAPMANLSFALRTCASAMAISWPFAATAQTGGKGSSSANTSVFTGQSSDGTDMVSVNVIINDTQFTAIPTDDGCHRLYYLTGSVKFSTDGADRGTILGNDASLHAQGTHCEMRTTGELPGQLRRHV